jgi:type II secretory ATPase GspE/PulE/Tfp pilus assembly ATPase PilB-like protein
MRRFSQIFAVFALMLLAFAGDVFAGGGEWPAVTVTGPTWRGPGYYFALPKVIMFIILFLFWVRTTDWASNDMQEVKAMDYIRWNPILVGTFFGMLLLIWVIPKLNFWIGFPLLLIAYVAPLTTFIIMRNTKVTNDLRVMTPEHIRYWSAVHLNKIGFKIAYEKRDPHEAGPPIKVFSADPDERVRGSRLIAARQAPGLLQAREYLAEGLDNRATALMFDYSQQGMAMNLMIDGVWLPREARDRESADAALVALKLLCGANPQDRQNRQQGPFSIEYKNKKLGATMASQGTPTGERVIVQFEEKKVPFKSIEQLGMRGKMEEQLRELLSSPKGLVLFSAPPASGLRTSTNVFLQSTDRFTREFMAVEDEKNRYEDVENVPVTTYNSAGGQAPNDILLKIFRMMPNVLVVRDMVNSETVEMLCEEILDEDNRLVVSTVRARDCSEALLRVLALEAPAEPFAQSVIGVVCQRLIRKLCDECKEAYAPQPQVLQQLGIPEGRIQAFYRPKPPDPENPKEICKKCNGIGYFGRTAVFELMPVGDNVRQALLENPKLDVLRNAARKDGMKSLQEEGILMVAKGVTSLPELMRVLKN